MNEPLIRVRKWFFSWQDEKQESWLGDMSRKGLHLKGFAPFGSFLFEQGPARDHAYRMDYNRDRPSENYQQLILDAGWEHLGERNGWHYWRKEVKSGQVSEIFTDAESKIQKYQRLFTSYATSSGLPCSIGFRAGIPCGSWLSSSACSWDGSCSRLSMQS